MSTPKKNIAEDYSESARKRREEKKKLGDDYATGVSQALADDAAADEALNQEYLQNLNEAQQAYKKQRELGFTHLNDIVRDQEKESAAAQAEALVDNDSNRQAVRWTAAAELGAGIVNMLNVGAMNAKSANIRQFSQDWMRKADEDSRAHRARIDNMKDRIRATQMQIENLRQADAKYDLNLQQQYNEAKLRADQRAADKRLKAALTPKELAYKNAAEALDQEAKDEQTAISLGMSQARQDASIAQGWAHVNEQKRQFDSKMAAQGLNPDGTVNPKYMADINAAAQAAGGGNGSKKGLVALPILDANKNVNLAHLQQKEVEYLLANARGVIKDDLGEEDAKEFEREFRRADGDKDKDAVLMKWMGKSSTLGTMIRTMDASYRGQHGSGKAAATDVQVPPKQAETGAVGSAADFDKIFS